jgi:hypothetical protein
MYLITDEEFKDVMMQENSKIPDGSWCDTTFGSFVEA